MKRTIGKTDIPLCPITLGTWAIGGTMWGGENRHDAIHAIQASLDHGIFSIDTAPVYGFGLSEEIVGEAIQGRRDKVVLATKCGLQWSTHEADHAFAAEDAEGKKWYITNNAKAQHIIFECEQSLKRLHTDYIDLYQVHWPDPKTPIEETWHALVELKRQGKVRAIGVSNYSLHDLQKAHSIHPVDSLQSPYSLIRRDLEKELIPFCQKNNISFLAYSPLERGLLTGKIDPHRVFPHGDHRKDSPLFSEENRRSILKTLHELEPLAKHHKATISQLIIHTTFMMESVTTALVGARNREQALENAQALHLPLTEKERHEIVTILSKAEISL